MPAETSTDAGLREVENIENIWIPMQDGVRLAARLWLPDGADGDPVPALLEYIPYRKRDHTRLEDEKIHPHLAAHGYACIRVDIRGAGDSEGRPQGEYVKQEQDDCLEVIDWLSKQAWCSGRVGMFGYSWGGFSALQAAMRRPPALKAIITHCSTDDRYTDGDQWMGGCIEETFFMWGIAATLIGARPPDPAIVGERWREMWMERLAGLDFHVGDWLDHQRKDDFWRHASVSEDYSAIECAVYAVGGWADHFNNTVARMLRNLSCPRKGLVGPWNHALPNLSTLGPTMDWLSEALRWWDFWLKDKDTGTMDEPVYRVWMQDEPAFRGKREVAGRWVAEQTWPSPRIVPTTYHLTGTGLERRAGEPVQRRLRPRQTVGITAPTRYYRPDGVDTGLPTDQQADDARSLVFDTQSLPEDVEIVGAPVVKIAVSSDRPVAFLAVRLNELQPDGVSKRVSFGVLNLTHRHGDDHPEALVPGEPISVRVQLHECAHSFSKGNAIRLSISTAYWPAIWPSPEAVMLTVHTSGSELELPVRPRLASDADLRPFGHAFVPQTSGRTTITAAVPEEKMYEWDVRQEKLVIRSSGDSGSWRLDATGTEMASSWTETTEIHDDDPASAKIRITLQESFRRGDWDVRVEAALRFSLTRDDFNLAGEVRAFEKGEQVGVREWTRSTPRRLL